jgi:hypothetical protein
MRGSLLVPVVLIAGFIPLGAAAVGCAGSDDGGSTGDDANVTAGTCDVFSAHDNRKLTKDELAKLKDPVAQKLLTGEGCPSNLDEITAKLAKTDSKGCEKNEGIATRLVNDSVFLTGKPDDAYRGVMTRQCDGRGDHDFLISMFGISPNDNALPQEQTEMIGFDKTSGVFNFYVRESKQKQFVFMGSSQDAVSDGYKCDDNGACEPNSAKQARCWACHEGGGLNMKELNSPWDGWNLNNGMPGNDDIFKKFGKQLGHPETGINLEQVVSGGNTQWNKKRIEILKGKGTAEVLRPLFCTLTLNLQDAGTNANLTNIPGNFFVSDIFERGGVQIDNASYKSVLSDIDQKITDGSKQLTGKNGKITDTQNAFRYPEKGFVDTDYIDQLIAAKVIDDDFRKDVLHVDLSRPVFSKDRCDLLSAAPKLSAGDMTPSKIRDGFIANLKNASGAGAQLLKNLQDTNDAAAHQKDADDFMAKCAARPKKDLVADIMKVVSHTRKALKDHKGTEGAGKDQGIIEFDETLPVDNQRDSDKAFDPATCTLK